MTDLERIVMKFTIGLVFVMLAGFWVKIVLL